MSGVETPELQELMSDFGAGAGLETDNEPAVEEVPENVEVTPVEPVAEIVEVDTDAQVPPMAIIEEPVLPYKESVADYDFESTNLEADGIVDVASMPLADFEEWLYPPEGEEGYEEGQQTLMRAWANLKAAGYDEDMNKVRIATALWARKNWGNTDVESTRHIIERIPSALLYVCIPPATSGKTIRQLAGDVPLVEVKEAESDFSSIAPWVGVATIGAILIPILNR